MGGLTVAVDLTFGDEPRWNSNASALAASNDLCPSDSAKARQRAIVLRALRAGPVSSLEIRERLGVLHAAGRVMELRKQGFKIATQSTTVADADGRSHRCALYVLMRQEAAQ